MMLFKNGITRSAATVSAAIALSAAATVTPVEARTLSYASPFPPTDSSHRVLDWWANQIKACTGGSTDIKFYYMQSLVKLKDAGEAVRSGIADIAFLVPSYEQAKMPLWYTGTNQTGVSDQYIATEAFQRVRERIAEIQEEEKRNNMKFLANVSTGHYLLASAEQPYLTPADFKGAKVRLPGGLGKAARLAGWNVTPVSLSSTESYTALDRGTIDGTITYLTQVKSSRLNEVTDHMTEIPTGQVMNVIMMNRSVWNNLTEKEQACFNGLQDELIARLAKDGLDRADETRAWLVNHPKHPVQLHRLDKTQQAAWSEGWRKSDADRVESMAKRNPAARKVYEAFLEEGDKVAKEVAEKGYPWERK